MVPAYGEMMGGVSAVIEYAVDALHVQHAVICGHTDCGAMKGILAGAGALDEMPTVEKLAAQRRCGETGRPHPGRAGHPRCTR